MDKPPSADAAHGKFYVHWNFLLPFLTLQQATRFVETWDLAVAHLLGRPEQPLLPKPLTVTNPKLHKTS